MGKSAIDATVNNQVFRKDWAAIIAMKRELATIQPVRLKLDSNGYEAGQVIARVSASGGGFLAGQFGKWSAVSGLSTDTVCVLGETITPTDEGVSGVDAPTGGSLARAIMGGYVYKTKLIDYTGASQLSGKELTDATGITVVKF